MSNAVILVLAYATAPAAAMVVGGVIAALRPPTARVRSYLQHFAAGVVFAALAVEVLPDVVHRRAPVAASIGFAIGVAVMLAIREVFRRLDGADPGDADDAIAVSGGGGPARLLVVVGTDILVDGLLIGVAFAAGQREGALVAVALAVELLSLGLVTAAELGRRGTSRGRVVLTTSVLALLPPAGAVAGAALLRQLGPGWIEAMLAFSAAALLYLVTEELLVEAHEVPETPFTTATFFIGFLLLLVVDMAALSD